MNAALLKRDSTPERSCGAEAPRTSGDADLLAQMIHDLKNPLSAILCYAEIVPDAKADEQREYCDRLHANARTVLEMLDAFSLLVALRRNEAEVTLESFDWVRQAMRLATDLHATAAFRSQRIACDTSGERFVVADRQKMTMAMRALILEGLRGAASNATIDLCIWAQPDGAGVSVVVPSESAEMTELLFDRERLAFELIKGIVGLHHGELTFEIDGAHAIATLRVPLE